MKIKLSDYDAGVLFDLVMNIGGDPDGPRGATGRILVQLKNKQVKRVPCKRTSPVPGVIYLEAKPQPAT